MAHIRSRHVKEALDLINGVRKLSGIGLARYIRGMYELGKAEDIEDTRTRLLRRWERGIDREMLREYKVLYYAIGLLLSKVGER